MATPPKVITLKKGVTTPIGTAMYPKLFRPDTKFDPDGKYSCDLIVDGEKAAALINEIDALAGAFAKEIKKKAPGRPYAEVLDEEGNDTGQYKFKASLKATGKFGPRRPAVYDSKGKQLTTPVDAGNGTVMRMRVNVKGYNAGANAGITLELVSVQIITLVEYGGNNGFEAVDGEGFVAEEREEKYEGMDAVETEDGEEGDY